MLYKYQSLDNFRHFVEILVDGQLWASKYFNLNDPMEGRYFHDNLGSSGDSIKNKLRGKKRSLRICSLTREPNNPLMWSHYADGHRGVVLGVEVDKNRYHVCDIEYDGVANISNPDPDIDTAKEILRHKIEAWDYEEEVRVFTENSKYVDIDLKMIITGRENENEELIRKLTNNLCPQVDFIPDPDNWRMSGYV